ncbi:chitinase-3-like protein 1 [Malaya genurostris]|uniref:chitinase-3-like protein 1 n=1 Tax=Malaya genurostris TaxID=325434 RepID=UPI0026F38935|nr:chitinase-3-like protein 1 [Malaya genurostris]
MSCQIIYIERISEKIVCYVGTWAVYRQGLGRFDIENINPFLCTHLIYAFVGINEDGTIRNIDPYLDLEENWGRGHIKRFNALKAINPALKTMAAVGGWNEGSRKFSIVAANHTLRQRFIRDAIDFSKRHNFDGVDLDWEYPAQRNGNPAIDKNNYAIWLEEIRSAFDREGLILSAAVASVKHSAEKSYDIERVSAALHFLNIMTYDMHGAWDNYCGLNSPLYRGSADNIDVQMQLNINASIHYWLSQGVPKEKVILGIPLYGRSFTLLDPSCNHIGAAVSGPGIAGQYSREPGVIGFNEFCEKQKSEQWDIDFNEEQKGVYATKENQWIGYDNQNTIAIKMEYLLELDLGGVMVWSLENDDFLGVCFDTANILMRIIYSALYNSTDIPTVVPTSATTAGVPNECTAEGFFPNPDTCEEYYVCTSDGRRVDFSCPDGLWFDPLYEICNWPEQVNCHLFTVV